MKLENWNTNIGKLQLWVEAHEDEIDEGTKHTIGFFTGLGNKKDTDDKQRSSYWTAIRSAGMQYESFTEEVASNRGGGSSLPLEIQSMSNSVARDLKNALVIFGEQNPMIANMIISTQFPHGRTGGRYEQYVDWVDATVATSTGNIESAYKDKRLNGEMSDDGMLDITPKYPAKTTAEVQEEE